MLFFIYFIHFSWMLNAMLSMLFQLTNFLSGKFVFTEGFYQSPGYHLYTVRTQSQSEFIILAAYRAKPCK